MWMDRWMSMSVTLKCKNVVFPTTSTTKVIHDINLNFLIIPLTKVVTKQYSNFETYTDSSYYTKTSFYIKQTLIRLHLFFLYISLSLHLFSFIHSCMWQLNILWHFINYASPQLTRAWSFVRPSQSFDKLLRLYLPYVQQLLEIINN